MSVFLSYVLSVALLQCEEPNNSQGPGVIMCAFWVTKNEPYSDSVVLWDVLAASQGGSRHLKLPATPPCLSQWPQRPGYINWVSTGGAKCCWQSHLLHGKVLPGHQFVATRYGPLDINVESCFAMGYSVYPGHEYGRDRSWVEEKEAGSP